MVAVIKNLPCAYQLHLWFPQGQLYGLELGASKSCPDQPGRQAMEKGCHRPLFRNAGPCQVPSSRLYGSALGGPVLPDGVSAEVPCWGSHRASEKSLSPVLEFTARFSLCTFPASI